MLKNNTIEYRELTQKDNEIKQYPTIQEELQMISNEGARKNSKFLILEPRNLKMAIMQLKTKNGHIIRDYYIDLEELLKLYVEYTLYFNYRESERKITDLEQMMVNMKLTNSRLEESNNRQEQYMRSLGISLEEVKDQNHELKHDGSLTHQNDPDYMSYYTIRAQNEYHDAKGRHDVMCSLCEHIDILLEN
jgi:hypothetical protein